MLFPGSDLNDEFLIQSAGADSMPFVAICEDCGGAYSGTVTQENSLHLLGGMERCTCGSTKFQLVGDGAPDEAEIES